MSECAKGKSGGIYFKVTDEERRLIEQRMALMGVRNMSAYIRKMCIDGYIVQLQIKELDECAKLLRYTSNNVNQIATASFLWILHIVRHPAQGLRHGPSLATVQGYQARCCHLQNLPSKENGGGRKIFAHHQTVI